MQACKSDARKRPQTVLPEDQSAATGVNQPGKVVEPPQLNSNEVYEVGPEEGDLTGRRAMDTDESDNDGN